MTQSQERKMDDLVGTDWAAVGVTARRPTNGQIEVPQKVDSMIRKRSIRYSANGRLQPW